MKSYCGVSCMMVKMLNGIFEMALLMMKMLNY